MAITKNDWVSFYNDPYFREGTGTLQLDEKQNSDKQKKADPNKTNVLSTVTLVFPGDYQFITDKFLSDATAIYKKIGDTPFFRGNHDGTALVEYNGKQYIIYIEMKSGYGAVSQKAIYQLPASSIKMKSYLRNLASYDISQYQEIGLIISFPPKPGDKYTTSSNGAVMDRKTGLMAPPMTVAEKCNQGFTRNQKVTILAADFTELNQNALHPDIRFQSMPVYYCPIKNNGEQIQIKTYLL